MSTQPTEYDLLSRPHFGLNGTASLWMGPDHLLQVSNAFGWERYRRWFYRDIQALIARRNPTRLIWNLVVGLGGIFIAFGALLVFAGRDSSPGDRIGMIVIASVLSVIAVGFLAVALVNILLGPTCTIYVQTAQGMDKLSGAGRQAVFEHIAERLRPLAEQAQSESGTLDLKQSGEVTHQAASR